jgi:hypothetical protein
MVVQIGGPEPTRTSPPNLESDLYLGTGIDELCAKPACPLNILHNPFSVLTRMERTDGMQKIFTCTAVRVSVCARFYKAGRED